ncbi:MAG: [NiFe]-hydrogenase assembly chaperone HybE [Acetobacter sp.]|nr:[NiFe]-hydrogenase assembly chaperone HybE [Acetobacter sp.]
MKTSFSHFEGSYLGDSRRLSPDAVMECKICWFIYDPTQGCETWQISPGTAFADLPDFWRCPVCDAPRDQFMVVSSSPPEKTSPGQKLVERNAVEGAVSTVSSKREGEEKGILPEKFSTTLSYPMQFAHKLEKTFREIYNARMRDVPLVNKALNVRAVGFQVYEGHILGMLITPWFMNIILAPHEGEDWSDLVSGTKERIAFPSGEYEFVAVCRLEEVGMHVLPPYKACSLFSPMFEFSTMEQAIDIAREALRALLDPALNPDAQ